MKYCIWLFAALFLTGLPHSLYAQKESPVKWTYSTKKLSEKRYEVRIHAQIQDGWHVYSQKQPPDGIGKPVAVTLHPSPLVTPKGKIMEDGALEKNYDAILGITQYEYHNKVDFVQQVELKAPVKTNLTGSVQFQVCTDKRCLSPETLEFNIPLSAIEIATNQPLNN